MTQKQLSWRVVFYAVSDYNVTKKGYTMEQIDQFIEQLLIDKGANNLEPEVKHELKEDMKERLLDQINRAVIMRLNDEESAKLSAKLDDPNFTSDDLTNFIANSSVDITGVTLDTMLMFRSLYLGEGA